MLQMKRYIYDMYKYIDYQEFYSQIFLKICIKCFLSPHLVDFGMIHEVEFSMILR